MFPRHFIRWLAISMSCCAIALSYASFLQPTSSNNKHTSPNYVETLLDRVEVCIEYHENIHAKSEIFDLIDELRDHSAYIEKGSDDFRIKFVGTQGAIEHVMAWAQAVGEITQLVGIIHTPTPATPLCTLPEEDPSEGLLDPSIAHDLEKQLTVRSRAQIVREYLHKGGKLYITYPEGGLQKRSSIQQAVYHDTLTSFPDLLIDWVLNTEKMDPEMIGATYLFRNCNDQLYSFSIKAKQANDPHDDSEWGIWFGPVDHPAVNTRVNEVFEYLNSVNGPDIREELPIF